ncbi:glycosyltransferase [Alkalihalobacterium bogoriense]|uniref:glycosyltransferase n=1 Tax=Alkalihalobacterium bogoriense TaxID=246272 RepID=UPI00047A0A91|nr:glycosyltransferase [Alkalihalobacterium bogoriense]
MDTHRFIIVRYSMITKGGMGWRIGELEGRSYKEILFSNERLEMHEKLFREITLPSLLNQRVHFDSKDVTLLVVTSDELPKLYLDRLEDLLAPYSWAKVVQTPGNDFQSSLISAVVKNELTKFTEDVCYATIRLDDDDALSIDFLEKLNNYINPAYSGFVISFGKGYAGVYTEQGKFSNFHKYYYPKIALGMTFINVYDAFTKTVREEEATIFFRQGRHMSSDKHYRTIVDSRTEMFMRTLHLASDTNKDYKKIEKIKSGELAEPEEVLKKFPFLSSQL